jgi:hypothetical protein
VEWIPPIQDRVQGWTVVNKVVYLCWGGGVGTGTENFLSS